MFFFISITLTSFWGTRFGGTLPAAVLVKNKVGTRNPKVLLISDKAREEYVKGLHWVDAFSFALFVTNPMIKQLVSNIGMFAQKPKVFNWSASLLQFREHAPRHFH